MLKKLSLYHLCWPLLILFLALFGCVHKQSTAEPEQARSGPKIQTLHGTILHKSSHRKTITLALDSEKNTKKRMVFFDFRTRGMEHVARGREVTITCKVLNNRDKGCRALTIVPADAGYPDGIEPISSRELKKKIDAHRDITLVDSRSLTAYQACHIPGALSLPACGSDVSVRLRELDHDTTLVLYCGWTGCSQSQALAKKALADRSNPFEEIRILEKGLDGWIDEELVTVASDSFVLSGSPVLIDLRPARKDTVQRIPGSISVPLAMLAERVAEIPAGAPVVVYGDTLQESMAGLAMLREKGFERAAMVSGDMRGWKKRHNPVTSGPIISTISWQQPAGRGEVPAAVFRKKQHRPDSLVLDLRTDQERRRQGMVKGSIALPLDQLYRKMDSLDRGKTVYCLSGPRGALASEILNAKGFRAFYLAANALLCNGTTCEVR
jgi:rhodanese-related sulfurtransferase